MNSVQLIGNLTRDPEFRGLPSGKSVCNLRLAVDRPPRDGEDQPPNYFNIVVYGNQAEPCRDYLAVGRQIAVDGRLEYREWLGDDDQKRSTVEVVARQVVFLSDGKTREHAPEAVPA